MPQRSTLLDNAGRRANEKRLKEKGLAPQNEADTPDRQIGPKQPHPNA